MHSHRLPNVCVFCELYCLQYVLMLSVKPLCSIVLLPFSAILTNLILFIFHVPNTTVLLFTVKPVCNLSLPLSAQPHLGVLCAWSNTHTMAVLHHGLYNFTVFFFSYIMAHQIIFLYVVANIRYFWRAKTLRECFEQKRALRCISALLAVIVGCVQLVHCLVCIH